MKQRIKTLLPILLIAVVSFLLLLVMELISDNLIERQATGQAREVFGDMLEADTFEVLSAEKPAGISACWKGLNTTGQLAGYGITAVVKGYGGDMQVHAAFSADGRTLRGLSVGQNQETEGYGSRATSSDYTDTLVGKKAPLSLDGYTGLEGTGDASSTVTDWKDGQYHAEQAAYTDGYRSFVDITVVNGRITAVNWDAYQENSSSTKKKESEAGRYVMTADGKRWHEQAAILEQALIEAGTPAGIQYQEDTGKTDAYAGVSIRIGEFVDLANKALAQATDQETVQPEGTAVDGVSGATFSSKAIIRAVNQAYTFLQAHLPG